MNNKKPLFFENLDGLRSVAFLCVFIHHAYLEWSDNYNFDSAFGFVLSPFMHLGDFGVSVFFVLSGFLITYLIIKEKEANGYLNVPFFYMRRVLRIWPLYYALVILVCTIYPMIAAKMSEHAYISNPLYYYSFLSNFDVIRVLHTPGGENHMIQGITWSVAVEEQFYLLWPLIFIALNKKHYTTAFIGVVAISMVFRFLNQNDPKTLYFHSLSVCGDLAIGGLAAYYAFYSTGFKNFFKNLNRGAIIAVYVLLLMWIIVKVVVLPGVAGVLLGRVIGTLFFAFVILEQNYSANSFYKFSGSKLLSFWGKYTYGLYLLHPIAIVVVLTLSKKILHPSESTMQSFGYVSAMAVAKLALALIISYASYELYEKRFLLLKKRFEKKEPKPALNPTNIVASTEN